MNSPAPLHHTLERTHSILLGPAPPPAARLPGYPSPNLQEHPTPAEHHEMPCLNFSEVSDLAYLLPVFALYVLNEYSKHAILVCVCVCACVCVYVLYTTGTCGNNRIALPTGRVGVCVSVWLSSLSLCNAHQRYLRKQPHAPPRPSGRSRALPASSHRTKKVREEVHAEPLRTARPAAA